jgi:hypothetical protein
MCGSQLNRSARTSEPSRGEGAGRWSSSLPAHQRTLQQSAVLAPQLIEVEIGAALGALDHEVDIETPRTPQAWQR